MRIAHITDCHIVAPGQVVADRIDARAALEVAIERIVALDPLPDLVVATGDLVNDGLPEQYDVLGEVLGEMPIDVLVCAGNHDDRTELRRRFPGLPDGRPDEPVDYVVDIEAADGALRVVIVDTTEPGEHGGRLRPTQLDWLDDQIAASAGRRTVVLQHHPPFLAGIPWMDEVALADIDAEIAVLRRHAHLVAVLSGHYHRAISVGVGHAVAWCAPSSTVQIDLTASVPTYTTEPPGLALHDIDAEGVIRTHVVALTDADVWRPAWSFAGEE